MTDQDKTRLKEIEERMVDATRKWHVCDAMADRSYLMGLVDRLQDRIRFMEESDSAYARLSNSIMEVEDARILEKLTSQS